MEQPLLKNEEKEININEEEEKEQLNNFNDNINEISIIEQNSKFSFKKLLSFIGPGFFISVGYVDPGNRK